MPRPKISLTVDRRAETAKLVHRSKLHDLSRTELLVQRKRRVNLLKLETEKVERTTLGNEIVGIDWLLSEREERDSV